MATFTPKTLASVQAPSTKGDLLAPAATHIYQVHSIEIHNTNTTTENVILYHHDGTNERIIFNADLVANETVWIQYPGPGKPLDGDDSAKITGVTDTASKVNVLFHGSDRV
ncbi:MAG: hypothetical protein HOJ31_10340 [Anaerolineae bacterium]|jgi:hypothetical protein|nr:hypothetical protein [Candidatus Scalindua sp.]MBT6322570.1 hypothetical protein [Anaerolineae bacterium]